MKEPSYFLSFFTVIFFLLPYPALGQTTGTLTIIGDTTLTEDH